MIAAANGNEGTNEHKAPPSCTAAPALNEHTSECIENQAQVARKGEQPPVTSSAIPEPEPSIDPRSFYIRCNQCSLVRPLSEFDARHLTLSNLDHY